MVDPYLRGSGRLLWHLRAHHTTMAALSSVPQFGTMVSHLGLYPQYFLQGKVHQIQVRWACIFMLLDFYVKYVLCCRFKLFDILKEALKVIADSFSTMLISLASL